jgi:hypothetical protein
MTIASTARLPRNIEEEIERRIRAEIERGVRWHAANPQNIPKRLCELDAEWDIERAIEASGSGLALMGLVLGARGSRTWLLLSALATASLVQHAVQRWCPPAIVLRRLGFRTAREIEWERQALKVLHGDFAEIDAAPDPISKAASALRAAQI